MSEAERRGLLAQHILWTPLAERDAIRRRLRFADFAEAFGFMSAVAIAAEGIGHYPQRTNSENRVEIWLTTPAVEGLSQRDAALAARIDELALLFGAASA